MIFHESSPEAKLLVEDIQDLTSRIRCDLVHNLGTLNDYKEIINESNVNIDIKPLEDFALMANEAVKCLDSLTINYKFRLTYYHDMIKLRQYLLSIDTMLYKFEQLTYNIKIRLQTSTSISLINKEFDSILCLLNKVIYNNSCIDTCHLKHLHCQQSCQIKHIKHKLQHLSDYQNTLNQAISKLECKYICN